MGLRTVRGDLDFLVKNPKKSLMSTYHGAGRCWLLINVAVKEIRKLRKKLAKGRPLGLLASPGSSLTPLA